MSGSASKMEDMRNWTLVELMENYAKQAGMAGDDRTAKDALRALDKIHREMRRRQNTLISLSQGFARARGIRAGVQDHPDDREVNCTERAA